MFRNLRPGQKLQMLNSGDRLTVVEKTRLGKGLAYLVEDESGERFPISTITLSLQARKI